VCQISISVTILFCNLGDTFNVDGDADAAVGARIQIGWNKFRQLVPLLTAKQVVMVWARAVKTVGD